MEPTVGTVRATPSKDKEWKSFEFLRSALMALLIYLQQRAKVVYYHLSLRALVISGVYGSILVGIQNQRKVGLVSTFATSPKQASQSSLNSALEIKRVIRRKNGHQGVEYLITTVGVVTTSISVQKLLILLSMAH